MAKRTAARPCARTLDRPITIMGLEPEDFLLVGLLSGAVLFLVDGLPAVVVGVGLSFLLHRLKAGKPGGYLFYLLVRSGWIRWLPRSLRPPMILPPPPGKSSRMVLSAAPSEQEEALERFYWNEKIHG